MARKILAAVGWSGILFLSVASSAHAQETKSEAPEMICASKTTVVYVNGKEAYKTQKICIQAK